MTDIVKTDSWLELYNPLRLHPAADSYGNSTNGGRELACAGKPVPQMNLLEWAYLSGQLSSHAVLQNVLPDAFPLESPLKQLCENRGMKLLTAGF
jgi:hypothetical protein